MNALYVVEQGGKSKMATVGDSVQISSHTVDKVAKAKISLENFYTNLVSQHEEREGRYVILLMYYSIYTTVVTSSFFSAEVRYTACLQSYCK